MRDLKSDSGARGIFGPTGTSYTAKSKNDCGGCRHIAAIRRKIEAVGHRGALERFADSEEKIQDYSKRVVSNFIKRQMTNQFLESTAALLIAIMPP